MDALAAGRHEASLREYFGAPAYQELSLLAAAARRAKRARHAKTPGTRVLILPGIMGSKLGCPEVLWIDPLQIAAGRLTEMALPSGKAFEPHGVLLFSYARLKLRLQLAGCDADFYAYDWRLSLDVLGEQLAGRIAAENRPVVLIAHSMGGLVARMAMRLLPKRFVRKLIMLGTPNLGSFAPVQALRGTYPFVRRMSALDRKHSAEFLTQEVFCTFPGLHQLLPLPRRGGRAGSAPGSGRSQGARRARRPAGFGDIDLLDRHSWPSEGPAPNPALLGRVADVRAGLASVDSRMIHIIGVNRETVVGVRRTAGGFEYAMDRNGDGTVPLAMAKLPGLRSYFVDEAHANLANNSRVIQAITELVRRGRTRLLPTVWRAQPGATRRIDDARLRTEGGGKIDWGRLSRSQREAVFAELDSGRLLPAVEHPLA